MASMIADRIAGMTSLDIFAREDINFDAKIDAIMIRIEMGRKITDDDSLIIELVKPFISNLAQSMYDNDAAYEENELTTTDITDLIIDVIGDSANE